MTRKSSPVLMALVTLALLWIPTVTASSPATPAPETVPVIVPETLQETVTAPTCSAALTFGEPLAFLQPVWAAGGCDPAQCDAACRAQGYDKGVCFGSDCICRFYYP